MTTFWIDDPWGLYRTTNQNWSMDAKGGPAMVPTTPWYHSTLQLNLHTTPSGTSNLDIRARDLS